MDDDQPETNKELGLAFLMLPLAANYTSSFTRISYSIVQLTLVKDKEKSIVINIHDSHMVRSSEDTSVFYMQLSTALEEF